LPLCAALALIAGFYGSVGQAGASGFLAVMGLFGLAPATLRPTALALNLLVSSVVAIRFARAGHFSWPLLLYRGWAEVRTAAALSAVFIFVNSLMALLGLLSVSPQLPAGLPWMALAVVGAGAIGAQFGSRWLPAAVVVRLLGITLAIAGLRLLC
jgi:uncharacterized membrane protein YfcA